MTPTAPRFEKGTRVQVLGGPFRGKMGVVQELDGKGAARVMLGLLATRVDVKELMAAAEGRRTGARARVVPTASRWGCGPPDEGAHPGDP